MQASTKIQIVTAKNLLKVEIETDRLYLRSYEESDFENCVLLYGDEKLTKYFDHGKPRSREEVKVYTQKNGASRFKIDDPFGLFSVFDKASGLFAGQVDLIPQEPGVVEFGCILFQKFHHSNLAYEALKALIFDYVSELNHRGFKAFDQPISKLMATAHPLNIASQKLITKLGLALEKTEERFGQPRLWYHLISNKHDSSATSTPSWNAEGYHLNSTPQQQAALYLIDKVTLHGNETILDIGCGDGKITATIAKKIPNGRILGIDVSVPMIDFAKKKFCQEEYSNIRFLVQDAQQIEFIQEFDVVFSSFALQWILDQRTFLQRLYKSLKSNGTFIATIPLGISTQLEQAIEETISLSAWSKYFINFQKSWRFTNKTEYRRLLDESYFTIRHIDQVDQEVIFDTQNLFEDYVQQWLTYPNLVPPDQRSDFFSQIIERYIHLQPPMQNGSVKFTFPRLDVIAHKSTL